jgi:hypothetical protein
MSTNTRLSGKGMHEEGTYYYVTTDKEKNVEL